MQASSVAKGERFPMCKACAESRQAVFCPGYALGSQRGCQLLDADSSCYGGYDEGEP